MSNNAHVNDDEIEIHQLPEVTALQSGMMVAVDSQPTGTKCFNLTTALEGKASASDMTTALEGKVDAPATTPAEGQVLTFNGSANTWANPPAGVYVLNYSEVTDIRDVDIEKAKTLPTFLKIDTEQPLTISVPKFSGSPYMVTVQPGTIMGLEEIGSNGTSGTYSGPKFLIFGSKFGEEVGGGIMQNADLRVICCIALSAFGGVSKGLTVTGNLDPSGNLFGNINLETQPFPITTTFFAGKGPGDPNTNRTKNALGVEFQSAGKIRRQVLMPEDIQSHDFSTDTTPEQIQFMGWGATSNRAGYKTINEVPTSAAADSGKVLTVAANGTPGWAKDNTAIVLIDQTQSASERAAQFADIIAQGKKPAIIYSCDVAPSQSLSFFAIYQYDNASNQHIFTGTSLLDDTNYHVMPRIYTIIVSISSNFLSSGASTFENGSLCYDYLSGDAPSTEITVKNNTLTEVSSSITNNISTLTITIESVYQRKANAAIELNPINSDLTLTVKFGSSTLRHSVSAGTTLTAGKYYQVTAVGNSWTLAEFEA